mmetsp:Transcript_30457/g.46660  ORF Transcript_30457/g.46660 Transcript_30457/m.46660 type:complete len:201 (+) Transcript_30457:901-1503(+)
MKKRQLNSNLTGLQQSCNTNPSRGAVQQETIGSSGIISKEKEREGSVDATSSYNVGTLRNQAVQNWREREHSETKENSYMTTQAGANPERMERGNSIGVNEYNNEKYAAGDATSLNANQANQVSPRGVGKHIEKMNVSNFIKQKSQGNRGENRFMGGVGIDRDNSEYQKAINRQGSKKLIQGTHVMNHHGHGALSHLSGN